MSDKLKMVRLRGGRMTKWRGKAASVAPGMLSASVLALTAGLASAQGAPTTIDSPVFIQQTVSVDEDVTITADGSVTLIAGDNEAVIEIDVDDYTADVLNQGTLAFRDGEADSKAQGILLTGDLSGTVTNEGLIELNVSDNDDVTLYGIEVEGDVSGTISNLGTIDVFGAATGNFVSVAGVRIGGELTGTVRNDGMIVVEAREDTETASAWGIYVDAVGATALIENNGTIEARASTFSSSDANAWGIEIDGDLVLGARVLNSGTIEAEAESVSSSVFARGLEINGELAGQLTNTGDIVAAAIGSGTEVDEVLAWGIDVDGDLSGSLLNEGRIEATVETIAIDETTEAIGIEIGGDVLQGALLSNSGTIDASATVVDGSGTAFAAGIHLLGAVDGTIRNDGMITVTASSTGSASSVEATAYGIEASEGVLGATGVLVNAGTITASATAFSADGTSLSASAVGIYLEVVEGTVSNVGTITVTATGEGAVTSSIEASAWGIYADDVTGSISNSGTISVTAVGLGSSTDGEVNASAYGIEAAEIAGTVTNSGAITATASASGDGQVSALYGSAYGVYVDDVAGAVLNTGTITVSATGEGLATSGISIYAYGIITDAVTGSIDNSGTITVTATASGIATDDLIYASAYGILTDNIDGSVTNSGTITVSTTADGTATSMSAYAYGIHVDNVSSNGSVINSGTITATATASGSVTDDSVYASAYGIVGDALDGSISNSGTITVSTTAEGSGTELRAYAYGIHADNVNADGSVSNSGTISATATASGIAGTNPILVSSYGMLLQSISGTVTNAGTISASATAEGSALAANLSAFAKGIEVDAVSGSVANSGTITVDAVASGSADLELNASAAGILADQSVSETGVMSNSGTITVTASASGTGEDVSAAAVGLATEVNEGISVNGRLENSGSITVTASASRTDDVGGFAQALGMGSARVGETGALSNTGTITATATAETGEGSVAVGIYAETLDGTLFNSGTVIAATPNGGLAYAVQVQGGDGAATFETTSMFSGRLSLGNDELTVRSVAGSGSIYWTFDVIPETVTLEDEGGPSLYQNGNVIATVAPSNLPVSGQVAGEVAALGFDAVTALMAGMSAPGAVVARAQPSAATLSTSGTMAEERLVFVQGSYISRDVEDELGRPLEMEIAGLTGGMVGTLANGMGYGVTLSGYSADGSVAGATGPDSMDSTGVVLGLYGSTALGAASLSFGASFGALSNESIRSVNDNTAPGGIATFEAEFDSRFISPALELSFVTQSGGASIRPYVGYRYTRVSVDGFTEAGTGGATFAARDVNVSDFSLGVDTALPMGNGTLTGSLAVLHRTVDDPGANVVLFGIDGSADAAATDLTAFEMGIGYGIAVGQGQFDVGASAMVGNDGLSGFELSAGYRIAF